MRLDRQAWHCCGSSARRPGHEPSRWVIQFDMRIVIEKLNGGIIEPTV